MTPPSDPVIIIGAGVVGLALAHGLANAGIPFEIYERDEDADSRPQGWAITLLWGLTFLRRLLRQDSLDAVDGAQVDMDIARNDTGNFLFLNLATLETKFRIPPSDRRRVGRQRFRKALLSDTRIRDHMHWGKNLSGIDTLENGSVSARFHDGSAAKGAVIVGAEGASSPTRRFLVPDNHHNRSLNVKLIGAAVDMTPEQARPLREIDPLLFQGCHPDTDSFLWVSTIDTPETNGSIGSDNEYYKMQLIISWPVKVPPDAMVPSTAAGCIEEMKRRAAGFHPKLLGAIDLVSEKSNPSEIELKDWPCHPWDNHDGSVTLVGDAAHAMTMFRGEAANHGIMDAYHLAQALQDIYEGRASRKDAIDAYESEMRERTRVAVEWSREACIGAHDYHGLNEKSAVLRRRAIKMPVD
ncbi:FAD binding domain [Geosmithia morbida]|uniref:FAD binding domain n=1 Tax=Geosmithia morbida TaxID=1094350 RepID=A0A9P4Z023_9HYPO|nr:FAD binding domain [Geosmithia morbida]KAF4126216.1 FAD binding domain [Geosmithia morbida]